MIPQTRNEAEELALAIIQEIVEGYNAQPERPFRFYVKSATLENLPQRELDDLTGNFDRLICPPLNRIYGIAAYPVTLDGIYTGAVQVQVNVEGYNE